MCGPPADGHLKCSHICTMHDTNNESGTHMCNLESIHTMVVPCAVNESGTHMCNLESIHTMVMPCAVNESGMYPHVQFAVHESVTIICMIQCATMT